MKKYYKWIVVACTIALFVTIVVASFYIYAPDSHQSQLKPGIAQNEIPDGVDTTVVFENVNVIPMDS